MLLVRVVANIVGMRDVGCICDDIACCVVRIYAHSVAMMWVYDVAGVVARVVAHCAMYGVACYLTMVLVVCWCACYYYLLFK